MTMDKGNDTHREPQDTSAARTMLAKQIGYLLARAWLRTRSESKRSEVPAPSANGNLRRNKPRRRS